MFNVGFFLSYDGWKSFETADNLALHVTNFASTSEAYMENTFCSWITSSASWDFVPEKEAFGS